MVDLYINKTQDEQLEDFYFRSSHNHEPLNELTDEEKSGYYSRDSWTWIEAIYILNGFKPIFQTSTKPMLLRFSNEISYFSEALARGDISKKIIKDGAVDYEDTVKNWMEFWRKYEWAEDACFGAGFSSVGCQIQDTDIHWAHWLNLKEWTKEQAASLICGFEPNRNISNTTIVEIIQKIDDDLKLERAPILEWIRWFDKVGLLDVSGKLITWYNEQLAEKELAGDLLLDDPSENRTTTMRPKKTSIYKDRDNDCRAWIESKNPPLDKMTMKQIHECLKKRDAMRDRFHKLWQSGFRGWWEYQTLIKLTSGRKKQRRGQYEC